MLAYLGFGPASTVVSASVAGPAQSSSALIKLADCRVESSVHRAHLLVSLSGPASVTNSSVGCASDAMSLRHASLPPADYSAAYQFRQLTVWSQPACDAGSYRAPSGRAGCRLALRGRLAGLNDSASRCRACPAHAQCRDAVLRPDYNYYAVVTADGRAELRLCPAGYCQPPTNSTRACSGGRTGGLCTSCDDDHAASLQLDDYISCDRHGSCVGYSSASAAIVCFTLIYVVALLLLPRLLAAPPTAGGHVTARRALIGCLFPPVYFYQLLPSVYPRLMASAWWPDRALQFFAGLLHLYPAALAAGRGTCLAGPGSAAAQRYFFTASVYWSQLALIALLFGTLAAVFLLNRGPFTGQNVKVLVSYFLPAFLLFQLWSNVPLLRTGLRSLHCVAFNGSSVLYTDTETTCYAPWQVRPTPLLHTVTFTKR